MEHGQIHPILVRSLPDGNYELITGEMRLKACMSVGLPDIDADIRELSDLECAELRLIENVHRTDLTDAEKGSAFLELWNLSEIETLKELAEKEQIPYNTVTTLWIPKSKKLSEKIKEGVMCAHNFTDYHARFLMKYPHSVQDKLAEVSIKKGLTSHQLQELTKKYDADNKTDLEDSANEVLGLPKTVTIPVTQLTEEQKQTIKKEKENRPKTIQPSHKTRITKTKIQGSWKPQKYKPETKPELLQFSSKIVVPSTCRLLCGGALEKSGEVADASVDLIITDPLYHKSHLSDYEQLAQIALRVLKDGGSLIVMTGQSYLPEILQKISKYLTYNWTLAYLTPGGQSAQLWERKVNTFWKPILWFVKGKYVDKWIGDVSKSNPNDNDKSYSEFGQSESGMYDLIKRFAESGQTIFDPFMGAGTTGVVALKLKCSFIGIDIDQNMIEIATKRLAENQP